ncbi:MAG: hypothetical protein ACYTDY_13580, partial [Planctomycetota bacterium]
FIKDLVGEQILRDKEMSFRTQLAETRARRRTVGWSVAGIAAAALLLIVSTTSFITNQTRLTDFVGVVGGVPEEAPPLETLAGCIDTWKEAVDARLTDVGLNYSDEIKPTIEAEYRELFAEACLDPMLEELKAKIEGGIPTRVDPEQDGKIVRDTSAYLLLFDHYLYLKRACAESLPKAKDSSEKPHLQALFDIVKGKATKVESVEDSELRRVIRQYGIWAGFNDLTERRQRTFEDAFAKRIEELLGEIRKWVDDQLQRGVKYRDALATAIVDLRKECGSRKEEIWKHDDPEQIRAIAQAIRNKAGLGGKGGLMDLEEVAGVTEPTDLKALLLEIKARLSRYDEHVSRIDGLVADVDKIAATSVSSDAERAREKIVEFLAEVAAPSETRVGPEWSPTRDTLKAEREGIESDIDMLADAVWDRLKRHVKALKAEGERLEEAVEDESQPTPRLKRAPGWWDTLILLAQAKATNERKTEYIEKGLGPWLDSMKADRAEYAESKKKEHYTKAGLETEILAPLREQAAFFSAGLTADKVRNRAKEVALAGLRVFLEETEAFWSAEFAGKLPPSPAHISEASKSLKPWSEEGSELLLSEASIREALYDITKVKLEEKDPVKPIVDDAQKDLERVFDAFRIFFPKAHPRVQVTFAETAARLGRVGEALAKVVPGYQEDHPAGRKLVADVMSNRAGAVVFNEVLEKINELRKDAPYPGAPADRLAEWAEGTTRTVVQDLLRFAAADINREWKTRYAQWRRILGAGSSKGFQRLFASGGQFPMFRGEFLDSFFEIVESDYKPRKVKPYGYGLELTEGFAEFITQVKRVQNVLFDELGNIVEEELEIELEEADAAASRPAYVTEREEPVYSPVFEHQSEAARQRLRWSPGECKAFVLEINFGDGFKEAKRWTGDWAVAEALADAARESNTFEWVDVYEGRSFKARVKVTDVGRLAGLFLDNETGGKDTMRNLAAKLPEKVVKDP